MKSLFTILFIIPVLAYSQTCVVAIKRNDTIMVGAESRVSESGYNPSTGKVFETYADTSCKIISNKDGTINFSLSGYDGILLRDLAYRILDTSKNILSFERTYEREAISHINKRFALSTKVEVDWIDTTFKTGYSLSDGVIFGREKDSLILHYISLRRVQSQPNMFGLKWGRRDDLDTISMGESGEIYKNGLFSNTNIWKNGLKNGIEFLINYSHLYHPTHVGGPINILMVTKRKTKWIGKKPPCY